MQYAGLLAMLLGPFAAIAAADCRAALRRRSFDRHCRQALEVVA